MATITASLVSRWRTACTSLSLLQPAMLGCPTLLHRKAALCTHVVAAALPFPRLATVLHHCRLVSLLVIDLATVSHWLLLLAIASCAAARYDPFALLTSRPPSWLLLLVHLSCHALAGLGWLRLGRSGHKRLHCISCRCLTLPCCSPLSPHRCSAVSLPPRIVTALITRTQ